MTFLGQTGELTLIPRGEEWNVEWKMDFASLSEEDDAFYLSLEFSFEGDSWYFMIRPNGTKSMNSNGYIDLYLIKRTFSGPPMNVKFCFSLESVNGKKDFRRQSTVNFGHSTGVFKGFSCHEIARSLSRYDLEKRKSEFLPCGFLTVVCTLKRLKAAGGANEIAEANCFHCDKTFEADEILLHEKKCRIKCPDCSSIVVYEKWQDHECQILRDEVVECSYCQKSVIVQNISVHEKKCMDRPIKCPECSEVVLLQKWNDHECLTSGAEEEIPVCEALKEMLLNGLNHDLILKIDDKELKAHQDILRTRSQVFKSMLSHDMKEKHSGVIDIPDCDAQAMEQLLYYIYTGKVDSLDQSNMFKLYYIGDKYDMKGLKRKCSAFIKESFSNVNICEAIQLALKHSDSSLLEHATEYFKDNTLDIMNTVEWQIFMKDNSTAANELMMKAFAKLKNSSTSTCGNL